MPATIIEDLLSNKSEPEPVEEPASEPTEVEPEAKPVEKPAATIPISALHEERERRKELNAELQQTRERMARMEALFERLAKEGGEPAKALPSLQDDPVGHLHGTVQTLQQRLAKFEEEAGRRTQEDTIQAQQRQQLEKYAASVRAYAAKQTDFQDAYNFLAKVVDEDLQARGFDDPAHRQNVLEYEEGLLVGRAMQAGRDPAEVLYNYAKTRGYVPGDKLERLEKGQKAAKSLSGPGPKTEGAITLERLAELADNDPAAFDKEWERAKRKGLLG